MKAGGQIFDEMDGIMRAYILLLRQANLEKRVMESALTQIANGCKDPQRIARGTLETVGKVREHEQVETPEMGMDINLAELRDISERMRDISMGDVSGELHGRGFIVRTRKMHDAEIK
jgi:hypothetical protein